MTLTLVGAAEPPPKRPTVYGFDHSTTGNAVVEWLGSTGVTVTPWQAVVIHMAYSTRS